MKTPALTLLALACLIPTLAAERAAPPEGAPVRDGGAERAIYELGVELGMLEEAARRGAQRAALLARLVRIRELAAESGVVPADAVDQFIVTMEGPKRDPRLFERVAEFREHLGEKIARRGEPAPEVAPAPAPARDPEIVDQASWEGVWKTTWGEMRLVFDDGQFHGTYGAAQHAVSGAFDPAAPGVLTGQWSHFGSTSSGGIKFTMVKPGEFGGGWSWAPVVEGAGSAWSGTRVAHGGAILAVPIGEAVVKDHGEGRARTWTQGFLIKNTSGADFSVYGYSANQPFLQIDSLDPKTGQWQKGGLLYCGTGAGFHKVAKGTTLVVQVSLSDELAGREIAIGFERYPRPDFKTGITTRSAPLRMVPPKRGAAAVAPEEG